jgi:hypothetical protein
VGEQQRAEVKTQVLRATDAFREVNVPDTLTSDESGPHTSFGNEYEVSAIGKA